MNNIIVKIRKDAMAVYDFASGLDDSSGLGSLARIEVFSLSAAIGGIASSLELYGIVYVENRLKVSLEDTMNLVDRYVRDLFELDPQHMRWIWIIKTSRRLSKILMGALLADAENK